MQRHDLKPHCADDSSRAAAVLAATRGRLAARAKGPG
jgi:hypothetical protein